MRFNAFKIVQNKLKWSYIQTTEYGKEYIYNLPTGAYKRIQFYKWLLLGMAEGLFQVFLDSFYINLI